VTLPPRQSDTRSGGGKDPADATGGAAPVGSRALVEVAAALIQDSDGRYLIARRREGSHLAGLWEFPGGKLDPGERREDCLGRELGEELGGTFEVGEHVESVRWDYADKTVLIHFYRCRLVSGSIEPRESQALEWATAEQFGAYQFPAADAALIARLRSAPP
jgi:8-oxo-dGTP diphosphatase